MAETILFSGRDGQGNTVTRSLTIATTPPAYDVLVPNSAGGAGLLQAIAAGHQRIGVEAGPQPFRVAGAGAFRAGQRFIPVGGRPVVSGAAVLSTWTKDGSNNRWWMPWTFQPRDNIMRNTSGLGDSVCEIYADGSNSCWDRDRLYIDGARATQVFSLAAGDAATGHRYFIDRTAGAQKVWIWTLPTSRVIEITRTSAFVNSPLVDGVEFRGFDFERFASPLQRSGINVAGDEWWFDDCVFAHMNSCGMHWANAANTRVTRSVFFENGQAGLTSGTTTVRPDVTVSNNLVEDCDFIRCNVEGRTYMGDWEAAAIKTTDDAGLTVRRVTMLDTRGVALWADFAKRQLWEDVSILGAHAQAARLEVTQQATVRRLTIARSGRDIGAHYKAVHTNWATCMDTAALGISESQDVLVEDCSVDWDQPVTQTDGSLNGIIVLVRGRQDTQRVTVRNNRVQMRSTPIPTGTTGTPTVGTMIAGGVLVSGPPSGNTPPAYFTAAKAISVTGNQYRHGDAAVRRFTWLRSAGDRTDYLTPAQYAAVNPGDATNLAV